MQSSMVGRRWHFWQFPTVNYALWQSAKCQWTNPYIKNAGMFLWIQCAGQFTGSLLNYRFVLYLYIPLTLLKVLFCLFLLIVYFYFELWILYARNVFIVDYARFTCVIYEVVPWVCKAVDGSVRPWPRFLETEIYAVTCNLPMFEFTNRTWIVLSHVVSQVGISRYKINTTANFRKHPSFYSAHLVV